jgi:hypothetical protein
MNSSPAGDVILVEIIEVLGDFEETAERFRRLVRRVEREGVPGLRSMQFYTRPGSNELAAVIRFSDASQMQAHTDMLSTWQEFRRFAEGIRLKDMRIHGTISPQTEAWIRQFDGPIAKYGDFVGGFERPDRGP